MAYVKAAKASDIPLGQVRLIDVGGEEVAICNVGGEIFAVANLCTHDGGPLGEGELVDHQVECPRHGARFDVRSGAVRALPAVLPIPTYEVKVEGDDILVDVG
ncbi:MAG: non-heme iron oxygenase ferredoxin subunit [Anaerolineae bacterium]|jgi:3-phenylpropionate/trans-cinnamate dioxygenase ferredoxin subunit